MEPKIVPVGTEGAKLLTQIQGLKSEGLWHYVFNFTNSFSLQLPIGMIQSLSRDVCLLG